MKQDEQANREAQGFIRQADALYAQGKLDEAVQNYKIALNLAPDNLYAHNRIESIGRAETFESWFGFDCRIHEDDEIFKFFANHPTSLNPVRDYLADGWRTMMELMYILDDIEKPIKKCQSFLEFATGFGRFTRHLTIPLRNSRHVVSDVMPGSVDFLIKHFGVEGFYSTNEPEQVEIPGRYDIVFVLSLFSHLSEEVWGRWLKKLYSAVDEGGVLIFTTHGSTTAKSKNITIPASGFLYGRESESKVLSSDYYGTTFTSPEYVRYTILRETGQSSYLEYPGHFWNGQDAYVIGRLLGDRVNLAG
jgi:tetratricopeptide (TPR) repeat protein